MTGPSKKQIDYALSLIEKAGYSTSYMDSSFKALGATMRERSGSVENWLRNMTGPEVRALINRLKSEA